MEKLNGKAKEDFIKWYQKRLSVMTYSELLNINDKTVYNALIIEFFDYWGFYIFHCGIFQFGYQIIIDGNNEPNYERHGFDNRNDATNEAIQKLVLIYNEFKKD